VSKKLLAQLNVSLLVAQSKFNPSKREILVCFANKFSYLFGRCRRLRSVTLSCSSKMPKRKNYFYFYFL